MESNKRSVMAKAFSLYRIKGISPIFAVTKTPRKLFLQFELKEMTELFFKGGPIFMGLLTVVLLMVLILSMSTAFIIYTHKINNSEETLRKLNHIRSAGLFALISGVFGQLIGLFSAFRAIKIGQVEASPSLFAEGFKVSMITTIYGILIFSFSMLVWFLLKKVLNNFMGFSN